MEQAPRLTVSEAALMRMLRDVLFRPEMGRPRDWGELEALTALAFTEKPVLAIGAELDRAIAPEAARRIAITAPDARAADPRGLRPLPVRRGSPTATGRRWRPGCSGRRRAAEPREAVVRLVALVDRLAGVGVRVDRRALAAGRALDGHLDALAGLQRDDRRQRQRRGRRTPRAARSPSAAERPVLRTNAT